MVIIQIQTQTYYVLSFIYIQIQHICDNFLTYITYYEITCLHSLLKPLIFDASKNTNT